MVLVIGEILMDIFPKYRRIGGAPFNFSFHLHQFGAAVRFFSRIGNDDLGKELLATLKAYGFDDSDIQIDEHRSTGKVMVHPDNKGGHRFEIVPDVAYDHIDLPDSPDAPYGIAPDMIYFGTLAQRTPGMFKRLQSFLDKRDPRTKCFYDINLRPDCYSTEIVLQSLEQADILKINHEELTIVRDMVGSSLPIETFIQWLMKTYNLEMLSLTRGEKGSELFTPQSRDAVGVPKFDALVDTVGAGDAYAAVLAFGYLNNWDPERILKTATAFSVRICQIEGAIPADRNFYEPFVKRMTGESNG